MYSVFHWALKLCCKLVFSIKVVVEVELAHLQSAVPSFCKTSLNRCVYPCSRCTVGHSRSKDDFFLSCLCSAWSLVGLPSSAGHGCRTLGGLSVHSELGWQPLVVFHCAPNLFQRFHFCVTADTDWNGLMFFAVPFIIIFHSLLHIPCYFPQSSSK